MKAMNVSQKILDLLASQQTPINRETIARQIGSTISTAAQELTRLRKVGWVQGSNGYQTITPEGREQHQRDPYFGSFHLKEAKVDRREKWAKLLGPEVINSEFGRVLLQKPPRELLERVEQYLPYFVLAWLVTKDIPVDFNEFDEMIPENAVTTRVVDAFNLLLEELES